MPGTRWQVPKAHSTYNRWRNHPGPELKALSLLAGFQVCTCTMDIEQSTFQVWCSHSYNGGTTIIDPIIIFILDLRLTPQAEARVWYCNPELWHVVWEVIGISRDVTTIVLSDGCDVPVKLPSVYIALVPIDFSCCQLSYHQAEGHAPLMVEPSSVPTLMSIFSSSFFSFYFLILLCSRYNLKLFVVKDMSSQIPVFFYRTSLHGGLLSLWNCKPKETLCVYYCRWVFPNNHSET